MDLCQHPEGRKLHGHTMQQGVPLGPLVPLLSFAKTRMHADILATPLEQYSETYIGYEPPWEQKSQNKLLWRGELRERAVCSSFVANLLAQVQRPELNSIATRHGANLNVPVFT